MLQVIELFYQSRRFDERLTFLNPFSAPDPLASQYRPVGIEAAPINGALTLALHCSGRKFCGKILCLLLVNRERIPLFFFV